MSEISVIRAKLELSEETIQKVLAAVPVNQTVIQANPVEVATTQVQQTIPVVETGTIPTTIQEPITTTLQKPITTTIQEPIATTVQEPITKVLEEPIHTVSTETSAHNTIVEEPIRATVAEVPIRAISQPKPIVMLDSEPFACTESKIDLTATMLYNAANELGFTKGVEVITHTKSICDMVFEDEDGNHMIAVVKEDAEKQPVIIVDLPHNKKCSKRTEALLKYLTDQGVVVHIQRNVHNKPEGILRSKMDAIKAKAKDKRKAKGKALMDYLGAPQNTNQQNKNTNTNN